MSTSMLTSSPPSALGKVSAASAGLCPFHDGIATLDLLLAELDLTEHDLFDAVLDLRSLASGRDASACLAQLFKVRRLLTGRHYLAFYRVRCWARRSFRIEVRSARGETALIRELPLDGARLDEIVNSSLACLADGDDIPAGAHVRFVFTTVA
jgi:hypothetical protein